MGAGVSVCVQHHPSRARLLPSLLRDLGTADVVTDPDPDGQPAPWRTYLLALQLTPADASHRVIVQDDVTVSSRFHRALEDAVADHPAALLALFVAGAPIVSAREVMRAARAGAAYAMLPNRSWTPTVALCWPAALVTDVLAWVAAGGPPNQRGDDAIIGQYVRDRRLTVVATVPSVIQHEDREPSLIGRKANAGKNPSRVAASYQP